MNQKRLILKIFNFSNNDIKKNDYIEIFTIFNSIFNIPTLVLAYEQSIIIYNLINKQIINEIKDIVVCILNLKEDSTLYSSFFITNGQKSY